MIVLNNTKPLGCRCGGTAFTFDNQNGEQLFCVQWMRFRQYGLIGRSPPMWQHLERFFTSISRRGARRSRADGGVEITRRRHCAGNPLAVHARPGELGVRLMTEEAIPESLADRPRIGRDQAADNQAVAPLSTAINYAIQQGDFRLAAEVLRKKDCATSWPTSMRYLPARSAERGPGV